jgi:hypothetical protein
MFKKTVSFFVVWLCSLNALALDAAKEYEIKAAFLFNLGAFVTWPARSFDNADSPFHICVLGNDPFGERLDVITAGQKISAHPVKILRVSDTVQAQSCEILFISDSEQLRVQAIFDNLQGRPVLTVGDMDNFVIRGGMVQFYPRNNKIRLMLDPETFSEAGLKPSAHLMRISKRVK